MSTPLFKLADAFPQLYFPTRAADSFLGRLATQDIQTQLTERRIKAVIFTRIFASSRLVIHENDFIVELNEDFDMERHPEPLGFRLAQTFHYNTTYSPPTNLCRKEEIEKMGDFCFRFAQLWVSINTTPKIVEWLESQACVKA